MKSGTFSHRFQNTANLTAYIAILAINLSFTALAQSPPSAKPEEVGLSSDRLNRLTETIQSRVDGGEIPGAVIVIARDGKIAYEKTLGYLSREDKQPMTANAIFRIASMSKPITSVAVMMLAEEGKIDIAAPVSQYLPEFKDTKVGMQGEPPKRQMTVQDLLRHTSGLAYEFFVESESLKKAYTNAGVFNFDQSLKEMVTKLAKLPLAQQPGTTWEYSMSTDVLGRIVEVASGMELDQFVEARIAQPLKLASTGFYVEEGQAGNIAEPQVDPATGKRPGMIVDNLTKKPKWLSGGGGMVSTADDYLRFCQMLLNGGELDGVRLVSPKTVALMTSDHLPPGVGYNASFNALLQDMAPTAEMGQGFGLGFLVRKEAGHNPLPGSVGDFSWAGAHGTYFWIDPKERLVAVLMIQNPFDPQGLARSAQYRHELRYLVYQALIAPAEGSSATQ
jgi:CubicO group peptidase (beta-lactamase class C family)